MKEFKVDKLTVHVHETRREMGQDAADQALSCLRRLLSEKEEVNIIFAAAPSQNETLEAFKSASDIDWTRVNAWHMDEYVGLDPSHPAGFRNFLKRAIFDELPFRSVNLIEGDGADPEKIAYEYGERLRSVCVDMCLLGIGENGHVAFNDPPVADFNDKVFAKVVELEEVCRMQQVHDGCFASIDEVPRQAITLTIPALVSAGSMFCTVPAITKARAVKLTLEGPVSTSCPASILRTHDDASLYLDKDSSSLI